LPQVDLSAGWAGERVPSTLRPAATLSPERRRLSSFEVDHVRPRSPCSIVQAVGGHLAAGRRLRRLARLGPACRPTAALTASSDRPCSLALCRADHSRLSCHTCRASRPGFKSLPSDLSLRPVKSTTGSETGGSSWADLTSAYVLDDLPGGRIAGLSSAAVEQGSSRRYGTSYFGRSAPGERSPWRRPRVLALLVVTFLVVVALAAALPVALHRHEPAVHTGDSAAGQRQSASTASAATPSVSAAPSATPLSSADEFALIKTRRRAAFAQGVDAWRSATVPFWLASQKSDGSWPDVDYTTGCGAQRANWPAQEHLARTLALAAMASGLGTTATPSTTTSAVGSAASSALDWWFAADFGSNIDCLAQGGKPCVPFCGPRGQRHRP
jgi:hypothetical protein